ncbi:MAG TPA: peptidylprolyl isomerase [Bdellovibrionota bacterium]|nr:peptidylprolyl isomerase [Bdellovibrionota bacterium]
MEVRLIAAAVLSLALVASPALAVEIAKVNGKPLTEKDLNAALAGMTPGQREGLLKDQGARKQMVQNLIDQEVLLQEAEKEKLDQDQEYKEAFAGFRRQFLMNRVLQKSLSGKLTDSAAKKYYEQNKAKFSTDQVHAMHILVKDELEAKELLKKAKAPDADFQKLAEQHSKDPSAKNNRGDLGFFTRGTMVEEFTEAAFNAKTGEIIDKPVKTTFGFHIIKVIEKKPGQVMSYTDVENTVKSMLRNELAETYVSKLREQAKISLDTKAIDKL